MNRQLPPPPSFTSGIETEVDVDGNKLSIGPLGVEELIEITRVAGPLLTAIFDLDPETLTLLEEGRPDQHALKALFGVLQRDGKIALDVIAIGARCDRAWLGERLVDRLAYIFACVVVVNADFFSRALPVFSAAGTLLSQARAQQAQQASTGPASSIS